MDMHSGHLGRPLGYVRTGLRNRLEHDFVQDAVTCNAALLKRLLDDVRGQAVHLDVDLDRGDALLGARDLEVHVAVEVLNALNVGERGLLTAVRDQAAGDARNRRLDRHAGVHQREGRAADRALRGRAVGGNDLGNQAQRVRELAHRRDDRQQRALCERAVADLTAAGAAGRTGLTDREGREVVVVDIALFGLFKDGVELLRVAQHAQRAEGQHLGLAAGEHARAVYARQHVHLSRQRTDFLHAAAVYALAVCQPAAHDLLLELVHALGQVRAVLFLVCLVKARLELVDDRAHARVADGLVVGVHCDLELIIARSLELVEQVVVDVVVLVLELGLADLVLDALNECADLLEFLVRLHQRVEHLILGHFLGARLDHDDLVLGCAQGNVHLGNLALLGGRVDDGLAVHNADLTARDNVVKRDIRDRNRDRSAQQRHDLGGVVIVVLQHGADDGNVVAEILGEQRAHRAVDLAGSQDRLLGGTALAAHKAARDAAYRVQALLKVDREREKVDAVARLGGSGRGDEHGGVAVAHEARAVGELRHLAGLDGQLAAGDLGFKNAVVFEVKGIDVCHSFFLLLVFRRAAHHFFST